MLFRNMQKEADFSFDVNNLANMYLGFVWHSIKWTRIIL
jgi:hypothetical protein